MHTNRKNIKSRKEKVKYHIKRYDKTKLKINRKRRDRKCPVQRARKHLQQNHKASIT